MIEHGFAIEVTGEGADADAAGRDPPDPGRALRRAGRSRASRAPGLRLRRHNTIPHGRGLGSSSAAIVAGLLAAPGLAGVGRRTRSWLLRHATAIEGHPDNVAAAIHGGFVARRTRARDRGHAVRAGSHPGRVGAAVFVPDDRRWPPTRRARLLPDDGAARRRGGQLRPGRTAGARDWPTTRTCCPRRRGTGCTRTTGGRRCRRRTSWWQQLRAQGCAAVISGAGPSRAGAGPDRAISAAGRPAVPGFVGRGGVGIGAGRRRVDRVSGPSASDVPLGRCGASLDIVER